jgi:hypothetical protein
MKHALSGLGRYKDPALRAALAISLSASVIFFREQRIETRRADVLLEDLRIVSKKTADLEDFSLLCADSLETSVSDYKELTSKYLQLSGEYQQLGRKHIGLQGAQIRLLGKLNSCYDEYAALQQTQADLFGKYATCLDVQTACIELNRMLEQENRPASGIIIK